MSMCVCVCSFAPRRCPPIHTYEYVYGTICFIFSISALFSKIPATPAARDRYRTGVLCLWGYCVCGACVSVCRHRNVCACRCVRVCAGQLNLWLCDTTHNLNPKPFCACVCRTVEFPQGLLVRDGGAAAERFLGCVQRLSRLPHVSPGLSLCGERRLAWCAQRETRQDKAQMRRVASNQAARVLPLLAASLLPPCCLFQPLRPLALFAWPVAPSCCVACLASIPGRAYALGRILRKLQQH